MRTNVEINDDLIEEALRVSGLKTKRAAVEAGLRLDPPQIRQKVLDLAGKVHWRGQFEPRRPLQPTDLIRWSTSHVPAGIRRCPGSSWMPLRHKVAPARRSRGNAESASSERVKDATSCCIPTGISRRWNVSWAYRRSEQDWRGPYSSGSKRRSISAASSAGAGAAGGVVDARGERLLALLQFEHALLDGACATSL